MTLSKERPKRWKYENWTEQVSIEELERFSSKVNRRFILRLTIWTVSSVT